MDKVKMICVLKTQFYSIINPIEGVQNRWRDLVDGKLKVTSDLGHAQLRVLGEVVMNDFLEPRKEFAGKTAALKAKANINFGANDTEALVRIAHMLKAQKSSKFIVRPRKRAKDSTRPRRS
jgi:hypothetical protein